MANLPLNSQYQPTGGTAQPSKTPSSYASLLSAQKTPNPLAAFTRPPNVGSPNFAAPPPDIQGYPTPEINTPALGLPNTRYSPLPEGYAFDPAKQMSGYAWSNPTLGQTSISNLPGGGQYTLDKTQPGAILHSPRKRTDEEDFMMLGGRSSKLYQIDHIVPLWAGGADVSSNKQILTLNQHKQKTDAQAVPLTLLANGKITPTMARSMALSWKEKDLSDLPDSEVGNGLIPLTDAERISEKWKQQMSTPLGGFEAIKKAGDGSFWKGLFGSVPEGTEKVVHAVGGVGKGYIPDPMQDVIGGFLEGAISGLSAGWASAPSESSSTIRTVSNLIGNIGGMLLPIGMITKGLGWSARGIKSMNILSKTAAAKTGFTASEVAIGEAEQALLDVAQITGKAIKPTGFRGLVSRAGAASVKSSTYKYVPAFALYGQATPRGLMGVATGQEDTHPVEQFFNDLVFGIGAGVIPPGIKGMAPMAILPVVTGAMFDPENPKNWLINAGVMAGLHGMGNYRLPAKVGSKVFDSTLGDASGVVPSEASARDVFQKEYTDTVSRFVLNNVMHPYAGEGVPRPRTNADLPVFHTGDQAIDDAMAGQINTWTQNALKNLYGAASGKEGTVGLKPEDIKNMDYADWQAEAKKIVAAGRHLYKQTLNPEARAIEDAKDIISVAETVKKSAQKPPETFNEPAVAASAKDVIDEAYMTKSLKEFDMQPQSGEHPTGTVPLTGIAKLVNPNMEKLQYYFDMKAKGKASPTILLVDRPDTAPFWRNLNKTYTSEQITSKTVSPFTHPENALQAFGIVEGASGRELVPLGWVSRKTRIAERKNNWNSHPAVVNGAYRPFDENFNKDPITEHMRKNGIRVLMSNIDDLASGPRATVTGAVRATVSSGEPFIPVTINDHNWIESIKLSDKMGESNTSSRESMSELVGQVNSAVSARQQTAAVTEIKNRIQEPAHETLVQVPIQFAGDPVYRDATQGFLKSAKESVEGNSPDEVSQNFAEKMGVVLDEADAATVFQNKNSMSTRDFLNIIKSAEETGWVSDSTKGTLDYLIKPFFNSADFKAWPLAKAFPDLRLSGGVKGMQAPPMGKLSEPKKVDAQTLTDIQSINAAGEFDLQRLQKIDNGNLLERAKKEPVSTDFEESLSMSEKNSLRKAGITPIQAWEASKFRPYSEEPVSTADRLKYDDSIYPLSNMQVNALNIPESAANITSRSATVPPEAPTSPVETPKAPVETPQQPVSPLVTRMVAKAAEIPTEVVTSSQKQNERMSLMTQPTRVFGAGGGTFGVGSNAIRLPEGSVNIGEQIAFPGKTGNVGEADYMRVQSSSPVDLPASTNIVREQSLTPRKDTSREMYSRALNIMEELDPIYFMKEGQERGGPKAYALALKGIIDRIQPAEGTKLSSEEVRNIKIAISKELFRNAKKMVRNAFDSYTSEYGENVPMSWEAVDSLFAKIVRDPDAATPQNAKRWGDLQAMLAEDAKQERFMSIPKPSQVLFEVDASGKEVPVSPQDPRNLPERVKLPPYKERQTEVNTADKRDSAAFRQAFPDESEYNPNFARGEIISGDKIKNESSYGFFEKPEFRSEGGESFGDILRINREKSAQDYYFNSIEFGKSAQPESYAHAKSWLIDRKLSDIFKTPDYMAPVSMYDFWHSPQNWIGMVTGLERKIQMEFQRKYTLETVTKEMKPYTQSKEHLFATGRGDKRGKQAAEDQRTLENEMEQDSKAARLATGGTEDAPGSLTIGRDLYDPESLSLGDNIREGDAMGAEALRTRTDIQDQQVGLTKADTEFFPGLTSMVSGRIYPSLKPGHENYGETMPLEEVGKDAARRGIEDGRNWIQFLIRVANADIKAKIAEKKKGWSNADFLKMMPEGNVKGRWTGSAKQKKESNEATGVHFENLYKEYLDSVGADMSTKFPNVKKGVEKESISSDVMKQGKSEYTYQDKFIKDMIDGNQKLVEAMEGDGAHTLTLLRGEDIEESLALISNWYGPREIRGEAGLIPLIKTNGPYIDIFEIPSSMQRSGMGSMMYKILESNKKEAGYSELFVLAERKSPGFWGKMGFKETPNIDRQDGEQTLMVKNIGKDNTNMSTKFPNVKKGVIGKQSQTE